MIAEPRTPQVTPIPESVVPLTRIYAWFSAVANEDIALLEDLLVHGMPIDVVHPLRHTTALMEATRLGRIASVDWFLASGAAPAFLCGMPRGTPLHCALRRRYFHVAKRLLEHMESVAVMDAYGATPLHVLAIIPCDARMEPALLEVAGMVLDKACPLDALDHDGTTALHHCVINDVQPLAELLLAHGAKVDVLIPDSWVSPLTIAALEENLSMAELLIEHGADPTLKTREGSSPLSIYPAIADLL